MLAVIVVVRLLTPKKPSDEIAAEFESVNNADF